MIRHTHLSIVVAMVSVALVAAGIPAAEPPLPETVTFNAHIRPIMSGTCFTCHGPDDETNPSGLRLDAYELATEYAIVPGDASQSEVYQRLIDPDDPMPPAEFRHQLSERDKALFRKWIDQGAKYEQHWSYTPLRKPTPPPTADHPIDAFIKTRLAEEGLEPSPRADKATLLRRLSLDLIGIPPTLDELDTFLADESASAYEKQVDRLLRSPHYGERMATAWLDLVRFSDTVGYHGDQNQRIFSYRDYVINAINENKPFDQFTLEQLAGDLLDDPTEQQLVATGLTRLNMMTREGGAQPAEYRAKYTADRVRMIGTAWLGSTTGCCECHNHKYDPFTAKDFYSLGAFFDDIRQWGVYTSYGYTPNKDLEGFNNEYPFPPEMRLKSPSLMREIGLLENEAEAIFHSDAPLDTATTDWASDATTWLRTHPNGWKTAEPVSVSSSETTPISTSDSKTTLTGPPKKDDVVTWTYRSEQPITVRSIRMEVLTSSENDGFVGRSKDGRFAVELTAGIKTNTASEITPVRIAFAQADRKNPRKYDSGRSPRDLDSVWRSGPAAWQLPTDETKLTHTAVYHLDAPLLLSPGEELVLKLKTADLGSFRISISPLSRYVVGQPLASASLASALSAFDRGEGLTAEQKSAIRAARHASVVPSDQQDGDFKHVRNQILDCHSGFAMTMVAQPLPDDQIPDAKVLPRGNWQDESGDEVQPAFPEFLSEPTESEQRSGEQRLTRVDLARWLTSDNNPLVARHYVNRTWKQFFGSGLSNKLDDLGSQGEWPSHPQLLDWLASEFREDWDMKHITRLIVTSQTYRQVAGVRDDLQDIDPGNRLLSQQSPRRLEAEAVRDNALAIAGMLNADIIGGRSVFPYQPAGYYGNLQFPDRKYVADDNFRQFRRGVYMHWQRTFLHPMLVNFDAPARDECVADRTMSNSPQQALTLLNDPTFVQTAESLAERIVREVEGADIDEYIDHAYRLALARTPRPRERKGLKKLYETQREQFAKQTDEPAHAALVQLCRVILNLHETITRY